MRCINYEKASRHSIDIGYFKKGKFIKKYSVGEASRESKQGFFKLSLDMFPDLEYFIVKDDKSDEDYTIFSVIEEAEDGYDFRRMIGNATVEYDANGKTYLKIWLYLLKAELVMTCSPCSEESASQAVNQGKVLEFKQLNCA